jgi:uroporphyrinogen decarboxylase
MLAEAQLAAQRRYGHEGLSVFTDVGIIAQAMGSQYHLREFEVPMLDQPAVIDYQQIEELQIPEPGSKGRLGVYLEAIERLYRLAGDVLPVFAYIPCPFTTAGGLRGAENFLMDTIVAAEMAHNLLEISLQSAQKFYSQCMLAGALPVLVDPLASGSVISRRTYAEFALPYEKRFIDHLHRFDLDVTLHICGDTSRMLDLIKQTGADLFSFDLVDITSVEEEMGDEVRLVGNLPPASLLPTSQMEVQELTRTALAAGIRNRKGFVLSSGCEVPIMCAPEKLKLMIDTGKRAKYNSIW